ncbi:peptidase inhibitor family I36 protein [Streptomyces sp. NPDC047072]|uniref:peptidase inhibitor family I36 protein n=1 Tax=Streptomyces sp. NPDC047072 TaxID=3154809 RepID=UPI0033C48AF0
MKAKLAAVLAAGVMAGVPLLAGTASATVDNGVCEADEFCVFRQIDYDWAADFKASDTHYYNNSYPLHSSYLVNDSVSSVWNRNPCAVVLYSDDGGTGDYVGFLSGGYASDLRDVTVNGHDFNNLASGHSIAC